jgi:hypothetical protein
MSTLFEEEVKVSEYEATVTVCLLPVLLEEG